MVTTQGFNALLKLVEEPPPAPALHLRDHRAREGAADDPVAHPPLPVPADPAAAALVATSPSCARARASPIEPAALPLIVRAGAGSARDSLSVLDQLLGGAGPEGVTHELATGLLGYTPDSLLDDVVDAFAAGDGAAVFGVVDQVIETGQDPRRFTEDLLRRLRDLVIVAAVPDAPATGLIDVSEDQGERLVAQAARFGSAELSRAADIVATGLTEMRGATAPRLLLELICARVLLPGADHATDGVLARLDRLEKRAAISGGAPSRAARSRRRRRPLPPSTPSSRSPRRPPLPAPEPVAAGPRPPAEEVAPSDARRAEQPAAPASRARGARAAAPAAPPSRRPRRLGRR